ncbi:polysaccharide ABC transporter ATP-binding protein [Cerasicoccus frondis]|uniref:ABC transporter ATP-binding protein n=1 Tax=Cerasicoccus frondis TaxID=490090 RepID=UPI0028524D9A|nr:ABC transporter ATP-binding protein [Cerasicoccus frondis]
MDQPIIEVNNLSKRYRLGSIGASSLRDEITATWHKLTGKAETEKSNDFYALNDISFDVTPGEILGVIGRNGAGKSTLLKILSRITEPTSGQARLRGRVASLLEVGTGFHPELTGRDNIYLSGAVLGMSREETKRKFDDIVGFSGIEKFIDSPIKRYSSGMAIRLGFAVAAHLDSDILIIDEVLAVGDINFQEKCMNKMNEIRNSGRTILFVSHNPISIEMLCHRCILLEQGKLIYSGTPRNALEQYKMLWKKRDDENGKGSPLQSSLEVEILQDEKLTTQPEIHSGLTIRMRFELPGNKPDCHPNIQLRTASQEVVFSSISKLACVSPQATEDEPTSYVAECEIPANFLNATEYSIAAYLLSPGGKIVDHCIHTKEFTAIEDPKLRPIDFRGIMVGSVRPDLKWQISRAD